MGARDRWLARGISRTLLLLFVAVLAAVVGAVPGTRAGAAPKTPPGDPPGNNGTVKIDQSDQADEDKGNEPIGDNCLFWLKFYGFDSGQRAEVTFAAHPPTGGKDPITDKGNGFGQPGDGIVISDTPAGGGQDEDATLAYNLSAYVNGLQAHPQHGYHIKLTTTIKNSDGSAVPGGVKHKVFWIKCTPAQPTTLRVAKATQGDPKDSKFTFTVTCNHRPLETVPSFDVPAGDAHDVTGVPVGTTCVVKETPSLAPKQDPAIEEKPASGPNDGEVTVVAGAPNNVNLVTFTNVYEGPGATPVPQEVESRPPAGNPNDTATTSGATGGTGTDVAGSNTSTSGTNPGTSVAGEQLTKPQSTTTLPRTGGNPRPMTTTGLSALAAGLVLLAGSHRRRG
jgi:hypothetical protein